MRELVKLDSYLELVYEESALASAPGLMIPL